ncbi:Dam family site-specific DNA-(adenine-N6)-methyltransferase [uncultured Chryseobacterium sp.]|uniref:DNA adenine methylase n=1 Tax=uncultured Chryseobacterium sp. TaxID=259322 RepID=UPI002586912C|nr:Dam family site-specific DNA-(adenine-N6)-methyltransferase [uncultured Chryseobacterium sp.]
MEPLIKWAGGKRWLIKNYNHLIPKNADFNKYVEPFIGGGSMFFYLEPKKAIINDINRELIITYDEIKNNWEEINNALIKLNEIHNEQLYYEIRSQKPVNNAHIAIRFLYLNRTCWNGLYRVNMKNEFNVPIGTKSKVILDNDDFEKASNILTNTKIFNDDFEKIISKTRKDDFLFIDPPYTVRHNNNGFIKYNENLFTWNDQIRLRDSIIGAIRRGVKVLVLNADHVSIREIYQGVGEFHSLFRASVISGKKENRGIYSELAIKCF